MRFPPEMVVFHSPSSRHISATVARLPDTERERSNRLACNLSSGLPGDADYHRDNTLIGGLQHLNPLERLP
jgi:hypothetical protein